MANNSSGLADSTISTVYRLNGSANTSLDGSVNSSGLNESTKSSSLTDSSHNSSILLTDSSHTLDDFPGFSQDDASPDSEMKDPFNAIFYHVMPLKDTTNIIFYNRPLYENILSVLSKEFANFPLKNAKKFRIKTHVDGLQCFLTIDRTIMSICASGPGHISWKETNFKKLSENMYRSFVRETNSALNTSLMTQDNGSLSASQASTQPNESVLINTMEQAGEETPGEMITQELPDTATVLQDSPVMRKISILMGMINSLQGQITTMQGEIRTLTKEVNELTTQAAYKTVDETYITNMSRETVIETVSERELSQCNNSRGQAPASQPSTSYSEVLQQRTTSSIPNQQNTNKLMAATPQPGTDGLQRTSTPKTPIQQHTDRAHTTPRLSQQGRQGSHLESRSRPSEQRISTKKILLMGDSVISPVNPRGLRKEVFKHSISGARIDHIFDQTNIFNMNQFSEVIIFVGGNDASNGTDIEYFEELYEQVILNLKQVNDACQIYLCNVSPRGDTDTAEVNQAVHRLCQEHNLTMVDINKAFYDKQGKIIERYYGEDLIHLSSSGVKRLLGEIDREINIVENFENCAFKNRYQKRGPIRKGSSQINSQRSSSGPRRGRSGLNRQNSNVNNGTACYKCGETNHETSRCKHKEQLKCYYCGFYGHKSGRCLNQ